MKNLVKHVQNNNALHHMWRDGDVIVVGVSGGPDSMCLLDVMARIAAKEHLTIVVAHVNYGLRGEASVADQVLVVRAAERYGFACETKECVDMQVGSEALWRAVRYDFFTSVCAKYGAHAVAVAHNKNDQAETLLLHLLRGSGLAGLSGMQWRSQRDIIRPLLSVSRAAIVSYCTDQKVNYHTDTTNEDCAYTRNAIRNNLLPYLAEEFNPDIVDTLSHTATLIADDYATLETSVPVFWTCDAGEKEITFCAQTFMEHNLSLQRLSLRMMIAAVRGTTQDIDRGTVEEIRKMIASTKNKKQQFHGKDLKMVKKGDTVVLTCA